MPLPTGRRTMEEHTVYLLSETVKQKTPKPGQKGRPNLLPALKFGTEDAKTSEIFRTDGRWTAVFALQGLQVKPGEYSNLSKLQDKLKSLTDTKCHIQFLCRYESFNATRYKKMHSEVFVSGNEYLDWLSTYLLNWTIKVGQFAVEHSFFCILKKTEKQAESGEETRKTRFNRALKATKELLQNLELNPKVLKQEEVRALIFSCLSPRLSCLDETPGMIPRSLTASSVGEPHWQEEAKSDPAPGGKSIDDERPSPASTAG